VTLQEILDQIRAEREYQDENWGTEFDDKNTLNDWSTYVNIYMAQASVMTATSEEQRKNLLKAATLLVAAVETFDRNDGKFAPRHYEDRVPAGIRPGDDHQEEMMEVSVREELAIARLTLESLLKTVETDRDVVARAATVNALLATIEKLVKTAHKLDEEVQSRRGDAS
jgi:hypothetical protein